MPLRRENEPGPDAENDDPKTAEGSRIRLANEDEGDPAIEGHASRVRLGANEEGPDPENDDPKSREVSKFRI